MKKWYNTIATGLILLWTTSVVLADEPGQLWTGGEYPRQEEMSTLENVEFIQVKARKPDVDQWSWQHGPAIIRYKGDFYASLGANTGNENTVGEKILMLKSKGGWRHWEEPVVLEPNDTDCGRSHGVFLEKDHQLWSFHSKFVAQGAAPGKNFPGLVMEAFQLNEGTGQWDKKGEAAHGIWPYRTPIQLPNGNYVTAGMDEDWRGVVAVSKGNDLLHWDVTKVNIPDRVFTEGTLWFDKNDDKITLLLRNELQKPETFLNVAVAESNDLGKTWSTPIDSNLAMNTCKPDAGTLSTDQRYMVGYTARDNYTRSSLTIAVGRPGETTLCKVWKIRNAQDTTPDGAFDAASFAYPSSVEYDGNLFVIYSVGDRKGHSGNQNHIELAVIPVTALAID